MIRTRDTGEIYLLSLDTFMIMAVMGLTLGTIFFIVNPNLSFIPNPVSERIEAFISNEDLTYLSFLPERNNSYRVLDAERNHYRYDSSEGWRVTFRCERDEIFNRWKIIISARGSNRQTIIGDERIQDYVLRIGELSSIINF